MTPKKPPVSQTADPRPPMRSFDEIQYAHDLLAELIDNPGMREQVEAASQFDFNLMGAACDALCWVLNHKDEGFGPSLGDLILILREAGYRMRRLKEPTVQRRPWTLPEETPEET